MRQGGVFINYRGADSRSYSALLHLEMSKRFGADLVFLDRESIPAGSDYREQLLQGIRQASIVLAVIGPDWLTATNAGGSRCIDDPTDWVRQELAEAFSSKVRVIPVLTDHGSVPTDTELPADLAALSRCQYRQLRHHDASTDLDRIATDLTAADSNLAAAARRQARQCGRCRICETVQRWIEQSVAYPRATGAGVVVQRGVTVIAPRWR